MMLADVLAMKPYNINAARTSDGAARPAFPRPVRRDGPAGDRRARPGDRWIRARGSRGNPATIRPAGGRPYRSARMAEWDKKVPGATAVMGNEAGTGEKPSAMAAWTAPGREPG